MLHEHPIKILRYTAKNLWLLIFPLLRSAHFFPFSAKEVAAWLHGSWFDLLICVLILTYGAIRWYFCGFMYNTEVIRRQSGILLKRETEIPCSSITSVTEEHAFFLRPFGAVRVSIHTGAEDIAGADMQLVLYKADLAAIRQVIPLLRPASDVKMHRPHTSRLLLFSFLFSSSLSGAVYAAAIFFQGGRITRDLLEELQAEEILMTLTDQAAAYFKGIPRLAIYHFHLDFVGMADFFYWKFASIQPIPILCRPKSIFRSSWTDFPVSLPPAERGSQLHRHSAKSHDEVIASDVGSYQLSGLWQSEKRTARINALAAKIACRPLFTTAAQTAAKYHWKK